MKKVITYGTYDLLHYGHIRLLERAKALGDYLIVGVTADDFDTARGKINVQQSLMERIENVKKTGLADEIIVEEYEGQKIDDVLRLGINIFTVGSDWEGKFDYLKEYCDVVYLPRTQGISSSEIRAHDHQIRLGICGNFPDYLKRYLDQSAFVNGLAITGIYTRDPSLFDVYDLSCPVYTSYDELLDHVDAVYLYTVPEEREEQIRKAIDRGIHILCESPVVSNPDTFDELRKLAKEKDVLLADVLRTAYATAYHRLLLLVKTGVIGDVVSVDACCTSLKKKGSRMEFQTDWNSIGEWGPTALLPVFQILGTEPVSVSIITKPLENSGYYDEFTKIDLRFEHAVATVRVGNGIKSEGELIISGTKGYIYVPAPWWRTDYFEVRYEDAAENKRYFYPLEGEGIRNELATFSKAVSQHYETRIIPPDVSRAMIRIYQDYLNGTNLTRI